MNTQKFYSKLVVLVAAVVFLIPAGVKSQLLVENFDYPLSSLLSANGWTVHSTNANTLEVVSGLTFPGYIGSNIGGAANLEATITGEDAHRTFAEQTSGTIYVAFLVNVSAASTTGDYVLHVGATTISTTFRGRVFVKKDAENKIYFGISNSTTTVAYTTESYNMNTTYLVVLKYSIVDGATNDQSAIYVQSAFSATEPTTGWIDATDASGTDLANVGSVAIRQGGATTTPAMLIDGIRVATSWADAVTPGVTTSLSDNTSDSDKIFAAGSQIFAEAKAGELVEVYTVAGQKIASVTAIDGLNTLNVNAKGILIVKVADRIAKVIL